MNDEIVTPTTQEDDDTLPDATTLIAAIPVGALVDPKLPPYVGD